MIGKGNSISYRRRLLRKVALLVRDALKSLDQNIPEFVGYTWSGYRDLDLIIILGEGYKEKLNSLVKAIRYVQSQLSKENIELIIYSHFRDESIIPLFEKTNKITIPLQIHLFLNYESFKNGVYPLVAKGIMSNLVPLISSPEKLKNIADKTPTLSLDDCLKVVYPILEDTYFLFLNTYQERIMELYGYRVQYIIKHLVSYRLHYKYNVPFNELLTWNMIKRKLDLVPNENELKYMFNIAYSWRTGKYTLSLDEVLSLLNKIVDYMQSTV